MWNPKSLNLNATRLVASAVGVLAGVLGVEHGLFEMLQGNVAAGGLMVDAIGPGSAFQGSEPV